MEIVLSKENYSELVSKYHINYIDTGVSMLNSVFNNSIVRGGVYAVCAGSGVGKTSYLLACAKALCRLGNKVKYISVEMSMGQILSYIPIDVVSDNCLTVTTLDQGSICDVNCKGYDYIIFDYLGADITDLSDWSELVNYATYLSNIAIENDCIVLTACQATFQLGRMISDYRSKTADVNTVMELCDKLNSSEYIAYSKGLLNKMSGASYIFTFADMLCTYNFKNRYGIRGGSILKPLALDLATKEFISNGVSDKSMSNIKMSNIKMHDLFS